MQPYTILIPPNTRRAVLPDPHSFEVMSCRTAHLPPTEVVHAAQRFGLTPLFVQSLAAACVINSKWCKVEQLARTVVTASRLDVAGTRSTSTAVNAPAYYCQTAVAGRRVVLVRVLYSTNNSSARTSTMNKRGGIAPTLTLRGFSHNEQVLIGGVAPKSATYGLLFVFSMDGLLMSNSCLLVTNMPDASGWKRCHLLDTLQDAVGNALSGYDVAVDSPFQYRADPLPPTDNTSPSVLATLTLGGMLTWLSSLTIQEQHHAVQRAQAEYTERHARTFPEQYPDHQP
ncbi:MAG: hypothetical protein ACKO0Z_02340 [Betaproteobacteria bacterium]